NLTRSHGNRVRGWRMARKNLTRSHGNRVHKNTAPCRKTTMDCCPLVTKLLPIPQARNLVLRHGAAMLSTQDRGLHDGLMMTGSVGWGETGVSSFFCCSAGSEQLA